MKKKKLQKFSGLGKEVDIPVFDDSIIKKSHAEILYNYEKLQFELHVFGSFGAFVQKGLFFNPTDNHLTRVSFFVPRRGGEGICCC